jgi:hypothetical protein
LIDCPTLAGPARLRLSRPVTLPLRLRDALAAAATGIAALAVYLATLAPGLIAIVDTPVFQFVGRVLGVPHNPGYPAYVLLTHAYTYFPIGSLAYRMNLFSAICGALSVALVFLLCRRLECRWVTSTMGALGLACGSVFWSQAVIAEVYTLNALFLAAILLNMIAWAKEGAPIRFYSAVALLALGLGNHTALILFAPGLVVFALLVNPRFALERRTVAFVFVMAALSLAQYGFIILRTHTPGAYVESPATNVRELSGVILGRQFRDAFFAFPLSTVIRARIPQLLRHLVIPELTVPGSLLALAGAWYLFGRSIATGVLLWIGAGGTFLFAATYDAVDIHVFLIPCFIVLWITAAVGAEAIAGLLPPRLAVLATVLLAIPATEWRRNVAHNDLSHQWRDAVYFGHLFQGLPNRSLIVREDFLVDRMVAYEVVGERAGSGQVQIDGPDPALVLADVARGDHVFAFPRSADRLRRAGLDVSFAPHRVLADGIPEMLEQLPAASVVALAVPASHGAGFVSRIRDDLRSIGWVESVRARDASAIVVLGMRKRPGALGRIGTIAASLNVDRGERLGTARLTVPYDISLSATSTDATIDAGARELIHTSAGAAVAVWNPDGTLRDAFVADAADAFRVPILPSPLALYPVRGTPPTVSVGANWTDALPALASSLAGLLMAPGEQVVLNVSADGPLAPRLVDSAPGLRLDVTRQSPTGEPTMSNCEGLGSRQFIYELRLTSTDVAGRGTLVLGGLPRAACVRDVGRSASRQATLVAVDPVGLLRRVDAVSETLGMARDGQAMLTGVGWSGVDADAVGAFRWMTATEAVVVLPLTRAATTIRVQCLSTTGASHRLGLRLNGVALPAQALVEGWQTHEWRIPAGTAKPGLNRLVVGLDGSVAPRSVAVAGVTLGSER